MAIHRVTAVWTGFAGAPGYSNFFFEGEGAGGEAAANRLRVLSFFQELRLLLPNVVRFRIDGDMPIIDEATGTITSYAEPVTPGVPGEGGAAGGYAAASGAVLTWLTTTVRSGRLIRGRTFLVPLGNVAYESDGTLTAGAINTLNDAAGELIQGGASSGFGVWSRPSNAGPGVFADVTGYRVPDMSAVLRSRRD